MDIVVFEDGDALAAGAAMRIAAEVEQSSSLMLGLAGGSTPMKTHQALAEAALDWSGVTAWIPDERWVEPGHDDANQLMAQQTLTDAAGIELLAPDTADGTPEGAAAEYGDVVIPRLTDPGTRSVVMLGMGTDGHTASLFPGTDAERIMEPAYVANFVPQLDTWRLTATFPLLATADVIMFLVSGEAKAAMIAEVLAGSNHPAARVTAQERVVWLLDAAAASSIR